MRLTGTRHLVVSALGVVAAFLAYFVAATPALAHFVDGHGAGWSAGLAHPFSGIDHLCAMVAVGLWGAQIGRRAVWLLPLAFPICMALGAALSVAGIALPGAEDGIAVSVAVLGVLLAVAAKPPLALGAGVVGLFGLFHGYAHGSEMPHAAAPLLYAAGFLVATAALHLFGVGLGLAARSGIGQRVLPIGAAAIAGIGVLLMLAL
jgi:urease accessory protein